MGMSASQARLIELEARQSNLEYQGQQINQERTILSQQCTALYNSLLNMKVPTPPSTAEFSKIEYSGADGASVFSIGNIKPNGNKTYVVEMNYKKVGHYLDDANSAKVTEEKDKNGVIIKRTVGGNTCFQMSEKEENDIISKLGGKNSFDGYKEALKNKFPSEFEAEKNGEDVNWEAFLNKFAFYMTQSEGSKTEVPHFMLYDELINGKIDQNGEHYVPTYDYIANGTYTSTETKEDCQLTFDASGRISEIHVPIYDNDEIISYRTISLEATKVTDDKAYQDAMAQYEYEQYLYDQKQQEINAKTEIIQQEDRNLELKLQRLDNERKQITTEIEAVSKVCNDNIEKSYKTFNG